MFEINEERLRWLEANDPEKARQAMVLIAKAKKLREQDPLAFFEPLPKQLTFFEATTRVQGFLGGNQAGKTTSVAAKVLIQCVDRSALPEHLRPYKMVETAQVWVVNPSVKLQNAPGSLLEKFKALCPKGQLRGGTWDRAFDKQDRVLHFKNGSRVGFMSYEMDLDKFGSATLDVVAYDEEPPPLIRKDCRIRLIAKAGVELFAMTPLHGETEITDELQSGADHVTLARVSMDDNTYLTAEEIEYQSAQMTFEEREAKRYGKPTPFGGRVFKRWDTLIHACDPPDRERVRSMDVIVGIDPGIRWTGVSWNAFDSENGMLTFAELLLTDVAVPQVAEAIRAMNEEWSITPLYYVIDPSARNRVATSGEQIEGAYQREGLHTNPGQNSLEAGVDELKRRLDAKQGDTPTPLWRVSRECPRLLWEIPRYQEETRSDGVFSVKKQDDHVLDSVRYAVMERRWFIPQDVQPRNRWGNQNSWVPGTAPAFTGSRRSVTSPVGS